MTDRPRREEPRLFDSFPEQATCPVCSTNFDGTCILVPIDGTEDDGIAQAKPVHLRCITEGARWRHFPSLGDEQVKGLVYIATLEFTDDVRDGS